MAANMRRTRSALSARACGLAARSASVQTAPEAGVSAPRSGGVLWGGSVGRAEGGCVTSDRRLEGAEPDRRAPVPPVSDRTSEDPMPHRRRLLSLFAAAPLAAAPAMTGCETNPATGRSQFIALSREQE